MSKQKVLYHGTVDYMAKAIKRDGLKPAVHQFKLKRAFTLARGVPERDPEQEKDFVYLTEDLDMAEMFARFRARYEAAPKGFLEENEQDFYSFWKLESRQHPKAKPVIVQVKVPAT